MTKRNHYLFYLFLVTYTSYAKAFNIFLDKSLSQKAKSRWWLDLEWTGLYNVIHYIVLWLDSPIVSVQQSGKRKGFSSHNCFLKISQEEVWEVVAQLVGLALGILILVKFIHFLEGF